MAHQGALRHTAVNAIHPCRCEYAQAAWHLYKGQRADKADDSLQLLCLEAERRRDLEARLRSEVLQTWAGGGTSFKRSGSGSQKRAATQSIKAGYQRDTSLSCSRKQRDAVRATVLTLLVVFPQRHDSIRFDHFVPPTLFRRP